MCRKVDPWPTLKFDLQVLKCIVNKLSNLSWLLDNVKSSTSLKKRKLLSKGGRGGGVGGHVILFVMFRRHWFFLNKFIKVWKDLITWIKNPLFLSFRGGGLFSITQCPLYFQQAQQDLIQQAKLESAALAQQQSLRERRNNKKQGQVVYENVRFILPASLNKLYICCSPHFIYFTRIFCCDLFQLNPRLVCQTFIFMRQSDMSWRSLLVFEIQRMNPVLMHLLLYFKLQIKLNFTSHCTTNLTEQFMNGRWANFNGCLMSAWWMLDDNEEYCMIKGVSSDCLSNTRWS